MLDYCELPKKNLLKAAVVSCLAQCDQAKTKDINDWVAKELKISKENLNALIDDGTCSVFAYRMRWVRTELKKEGKIDSPIKGIWRLVKEK